MALPNPPYYKTPEEMQQAIDDYFNGAMRTRTRYTSDGTPYNVPVPTITGLAIHLGFESRQSFYDYEKREAFSYTIKRARTFIEREYEESLQAGNVTGAIFALKNMGWYDKVEQETKHTFVSGKVELKAEGDEPTIQSK